MGAKEELIKSVAQAIPNHVMTVFKLPVGFHEDYTRLVRNFWWGDDEKKRGSLGILGCPYYAKGVWGRGL
jgi:hypothetical protein